MRDWNGGATGQRQTGTVGDLKMEQQRNCTRTGTVGNSLNIFGYHEGVPVQADLLRARLRLRGRIVQVRVSLGSASG